MHNTTLLNYLYQNAKMGVQTIGKLIEIIEGCNNELQTVLQNQLGKYNEFLTVTEEHITSRGGKIEPISPIQTFMSDMMIDIKTMMDKSTSHIAAMMMRGTTMGIIEATKTIKSNKSADPEILSIANDLLCYECEQFDKLKSLL